MNTSFIPKKDPALERRRALAKVYEFLMKLAETAEHQPEDLNPNNEENETTTLKDNIPP